MAGETVAQYIIRADELQQAFDRFDQLNLANRLNYARGALVPIMGKYTQRDPKLSAGCETGIKLGLLIAEMRYRRVLPEPDKEGGDPNAKTR